MVEPRRRRPLHDELSGATIALVCADVIALASVAVAFRPAPLPGLAFVLVLLYLRVTIRLYRRRLTLSALDDLPRAVGSLTAAAVAAFAINLTADPGGAGVPPLALAMTAFALLSGLLRIIALHYSRAARRAGRQERAIILGAGTIGRAIATALVERPELGLRPVGFVDPDPTLSSNLLPVALIGDRPTELARLIREFGAGAVVMAFSTARERDLVDAVITTHRLGCVLYVVPRMFELHPDSPEVERVAGYPLVRIWMDPTTRPTWFIKVLFDRVVAALALVLALPVLVAAALAVVIESGRPIFFRQERIGLDGRPFEIIKLRSLTPTGDQESQTTWNIATDPRVGPVGRFIRRTSVDELPQLWNIICGQMSFVGPRPERPGFAAQFSGEHQRYWARHRVPAGLTGLAQVNGWRGDTSISERARFDNLYITNWNLWLDVKIMILTLRELVQPGPR